MKTKIENPREGWMEACKKAVESDQEKLLEMPESEWDSEEWQW